MNVFVVASSITDSVWTRSRSQLDHLNEPLPLKNKQNPPVCFRFFHFFQIRVSKSWNAGPLLGGCAFLPVPIADRRVLFSVLES